MKVSAFAVMIVVAAAVSGGRTHASGTPAARDDGNYNVSAQQVPTWSKEDLNFFLHGSMSTEVIPEPMLRAFIKTYPDLFPASDLTYLGLIPDPDFGWPIGISRKAQVKYLGGLPAVGINCASCHVAQITSTSHNEPIQILGVTSHFNVEAFFGSVLVATFKTSDPENMKRFLAAYLAVSDPKNDTENQKLFETAWKHQEKGINEALKADPLGTKDIGPGELHQIDNESLRLNQLTLERDGDVATCAQSIVKLFHNIRAALHVPDQPPEKI